MTRFYCSIKWRKKKQPCDRLLFSTLLESFKLGAHVDEEFFFVGELGASFGNELGWSFLDIIVVLEAFGERVVLFFAFNDAIFEAINVLSFNIVWELEIDIVVARDGEMKATGLLWLDKRNSWSLGEMLNEKLVGVHDIVVKEGDWESLGTWNGLIVAANASNNINELFEVVDAFFVDSVEFWPSGSN